MSQDSVSLYSIPHNQSVAGSHKASLDELERQYKAKLEQQAKESESQQPAINDRIVFLESALRNIRSLGFKHGAYQQSFVKAVRIASDALGVPTPSIPPPPPRNQYRKEYIADLEEQLEEAKQEIDFLKQPPIKAWWQFWK